MNWTQFFIWVTGGYLVYYLVVFLTDIPGNKRSEKSPDTKNQLSFSETFAPAQVDFLQEDSQFANNVSGKNAHEEPDVIGSGGVSIKDLFSLARKEVVIYTKQVSY